MFVEFCEVDEKLATRLLRALACALKSLRVEESIAGCIIDYLGPFDTILVADFEWVMEGPAVRELADCT